MLTRKIVQCKRLRSQFRHRRAGISHRTNLVGIKIFPPIQRSRDVQIHRNHSPIPRILKSHHQIVVCFTELPGMIICMRAGIAIDTILASDTIIPTFADSAIGFIPTAHRMPYSSDSVFPSHNLYIFNFNHCLLLSWVLGRL